jgi:DNA-directed RNA polymerase sigma subunit (sigma70/sigma32)
MLTVKALQDYNPNRGAAVGTHVASRLRKISRFVYPYQNIARLPENKQLLYNTYDVAFNQLYDEKGREPTVAELADNLKWSQRKISDFQQTFGRRELVESQGIPVEEDAEDGGLVDFYYHGLNPSDQGLFEDITGYSGKMVLTNTQLRNKHRLTQGQLSYRKRKFIDQVKDIQMGRI